MCSAPAGQHHSGAALAEEAVGDEEGAVVTKVQRLVDDFRADDQRRAATAHLWIKGGSEEGMAGERGHGRKANWAHTRLPVCQCVRREPGKAGLLAPRTCSASAASPTAITPALQPMPERL